MKPYFKTRRGKIYCGDCLDVMRQLPDQSINCGVTSPPYWGLRDYEESRQIGLEETPEKYVDKLVGVFREFRRVLKNEGTLWLNLGDSYARSAQSDNRSREAKLAKSGLKLKNLLGIPWRVAFALQSNDWYLRQDIIWHKPNSMPESVKDRCTKAHEYIFLLSKSPKYYFDNEVIKEPTVTRDKNVRDREATSLNKVPGRKRMEGLKTNNYAFRNKRSVWSVPTKSFKENHFATFPPDLILPCVLAGCPENGVVMDIFGGVGTTGLVAVQNQRNFILSELSVQYCQIAAKRIEAAASQKSFEDYL